MKPEEIDFDNLSFSHTPTRSMYISKRKLNDDKWEKGELYPFGEISLSPAAGVLNYGQGLFEGMKAYKGRNDKPRLFRPHMNASRMAEGCARLAIPPITEEVFLDGVMKTVLDNQDYIPTPEQGALYIRPLTIGNGPIVGVAPSPEFTFLVYVQPVAPYFKGSLKPIDLIVTNDYHRAALKGTGGVKAIGNYVAGMKPAGEARSAGYSEVIYLDAAEEKYVEEVGAANFFALFGDTLVTPMLTGSILPGITRDSTMHLALDKFGIKTEERRITIDEALTADEVFCAGTAAILTPIGKINYKGEDYIFSDGQVGKTTRKLYDALTSIQFGDVSDPYDWIVEL